MTRFAILFYLLFGFYNVSQAAQNGTISVKKDSVESGSVLKRKEDLERYVSSDDIVNLRRALEKAYNKDEINERHGVSGNTLVMIATKKSNFDSVKFLLQKKANPSIADVGLATPLHIASRNCNLPIAKLLIQYNSPIDAKDIEGYTPLMRSVDFGCDKVFALLLGKQASLSTKNQSSKTAIELIENINDSSVKANFKSILKKSQTN